MKHVSNIEALVKTLLQSDLFHSLVIQSPPGWGKTTTVGRALQNLNQQYVSTGSYSTPLALFRCLCENPSQLLLLDDCAGVFSDPIAMALLKSATWPNNEGQRKVTWATTAEKANQSSVVFSGKIILLTNQMPLGHTVSSFLSRSLFYKFSFSPSEAAELLRSAAVTNGGAVAIEVAEFLAKQVEDVGPGRISFRTFELGCEVARIHPGNWAELLSSLLPKSNYSGLVLELAATGVSVRAQCLEFQKQTGLSERTFYNYRSKISQEEEKQPSALCPERVCSLPNSDPSDSR